MASPANWTPAPQRIRCLSDEERGHLHAALLCIRLHERRRGVSLPAELLHPLLLAAQPDYGPFAGLAIGLGFLFIDDEL